VGVETGDRARSVDVLGVSDRAGGTLPIKLSDLPDLLRPECFDRRTVIGFADARRSGCVARAASGTCAKEFNRRYEFWFATSHAGLFEFSIRAIGRLTKTDPPCQPARSCA